MSLISLPALVLQSSQRIGVRLSRSASLVEIRRVSACPDKIVWSVANSLPTLLSQTIIPTSWNHCSKKPLEMHPSRSNRSRMRETWKRSGRIVDPVRKAELAKEEWKIITPAQSHHQGKTLRNRIKGAAAITTNTTVRNSKLIWAAWQESENNNSKRWTNMSMEQFLKVTALLSRLKPASEWINLVWLADPHLASRLNAKPCHHFRSLVKSETLLLVAHQKLWIS